MNNVERSTEDVYLEKRDERDHAQEVFDASHGIQRVIGRISLWKATHSFEKAATENGLIVVNGDVIKPIKVSLEYFNQVEDDVFSRDK